MCHPEDDPGQFSAWLSELPGSLLALDEQLAAEVKARGCPHCGQGRLHVASYPRKVRGIGAEHEWAFARRLSFCCDRPGCRKRTTPPSVRFLGRRVYAAPWVIMAVAYARVSLVLARRTVKRWSAFWQKDLPADACWQAARARLDAPVDTAALPRSLLERFAGPLPERVVALLMFMARLGEVRIGAHRARNAMGP